MTREEALKVLKELHKTALFSVRSALEVFCPELAESEDDKIREALCDIVRDMPYMETELRAHGLTVEKTIAYLERQKKRKIKFKSEELQEERRRGIQCVLDCPEAYGLQKKDDEPMCDELSEEIERISKRYPEISFAKLSRIAVHFAKWKKDVFTHHEPYESLIEAVDRQMEDDGDVDDFVRRGIDEIALKYARLGVDWLKDWLEGQKEPNYTKRNALFDKCVENCDPEIMKRVSDEIDAELQKEQKPVNPSDDELQRHQDELHAFKVFAVKQAKEHHIFISFVHDFEWDNFCAELLSYFNKQKEQKSEIPLMNGDADLYFDNWNQMQDEPPTRRQCFEEGMRYSQRLQKPVEIDNKEIELSDFESELFSAFSDEWQQYLRGEEVDVAQWVKEHSAQLLDVAKRELKSEEWSEEDAEMLDMIISGLTADKIINYAHDCQGQAEMQRRIDWLKSLRPQPKQKDRYQEGFEDGVYEGRRKALEEYNKSVAFHYDGDFNHKLSCREGGPCTNPHFDCFNCPRRGDSAVKTYTSPNTIEYQPSTQPRWKPGEEQLAEALVARDIDGSLILYINPDHKMELPSEMFPELTWGGEKNAIKVELIIRPL